MLQRQLKSWDRVWKTPNVFSETEKLQNERHHSLINWLYSSGNLTGKDLDSYDFLGNPATKLDSISWKKCEKIEILNKHSAKNKCSLCFAWLKKANLKFRLSCMIVWHRCALHFLQYNRIWHVSCFQCKVLNCHRQWWLKISKWQERNSENMDAC